MRLWEDRWSRESGWGRAAGDGESRSHLVLAFGSQRAIAAAGGYAELARRHPAAHVLGCSTAGEVFGTHVADGWIVESAIEFDRTVVRTARVDVAGFGDAEAAGLRLGQDLSLNGLSHVFVLSDGTHVNGSALVRGITRGLPAGVGVTGGLAADGNEFKETAVMCDGEPRSGIVAAVGFYGPALKVGYGSVGGWDPFGAERVVTRSSGNVVLEIDGQPALALYKRYLGDHARELPASGLLFPLSVRRDRNEPSIVRTILAVDEAAQTLTFAGDVAEGSYARLMKANINRLLDGAVDAARDGLLAGAPHPTLAILISCVGRRLVFGQRIEEEVEAVHDVLGGATALTGFYSYGEIAPVAGGQCELHNQTMTITTLTER
jgi:hypothetical protein